MSPRGQSGSGPNTKTAMATTATARSGTSAAAVARVAATRPTVIAYMGTISGHNWFALRRANGQLGYVMEDSTGFVAVKPDQYPSITGNFLDGKALSLIPSPVPATALANRSVPATAGNAIPKANANGTARKRIRNRVSRASPVATTA